MASVVRVLVLDDDEPIRTSLASYLEDEGFEPVPAENGEQALEIIKNQDLEVAIVDMRLPGIDGDAVIFQAHEIQPEMKFIIYTGSDDYVPQNTLTDVGMRPEHVFFKPLRRMEVLIETINDLIKK